MPVIADADAVVQLLDQHLGWILVAVVAIFWIVFGTTGSVLKRRAFERTRREVAAYVAEGSIPPERAERLLAVRSLDYDDNSELS